MGNQPGLGSDQNVPGFKIQIDTRDLDRALQKVKTTARGIESEVERLGRSGRSVRLLNDAEIARALTAVQSQFRQTNTVVASQVNGIQRSMQQLNRAMSSAATQSPMRLSEQVRASIRQQVQLRESLAAASELASTLNNKVQRAFTAQFQAAVRLDQQRQQMVQQQTQQVQRARQAELQQLEQQTRAESRILRQANTARQEIRRAELRSAQREINATQAALTAVNSQYLRQVERFRGIRADLPVGLDQRMVRDVTSAFSASRVPIVDSSAKLRALRAELQQIRLDPNGVVPPELLRRAVELRKEINTGVVSGVGKLESALVRLRQNGERSLQALALQAQHLGQALVPVGLAFGGAAAVGVQAAAMRERIQFRFRNIFGDEAEATAALDAIEKRARRLNVPVMRAQEAMLRYIPTIGKARDQMEKLLDLTIRLASIDPGTGGGVQGAAFAINEALSSVFNLKAKRPEDVGGDLLSLTERFGLSRRQLREAILQEGDFVRGLDAYLKKIGATTAASETFGRTFAGALTLATGSIQDMMATAFEPATEGLAGLLATIAKILQALDANAPVLLKFAGNFISITLAIGGAIFIISQLITAVTALKVALAGVTFGGILAGGIAFGPLLAGLAAIAAAITGIGLAIGEVNKQAAETERWQREEASEDAVRIARAGGITADYSRLADVREVINKYNSDVEELRNLIANSLNNPVVLSHFRAYLAYGEGERQRLINELDRIVRNLYDELGISRTREQAEALRNALEQADANASAFLRALVDNVDREVIEAMSVRGVFNASDGSSPSSQAAISTWYDMIDKGYDSAQAYIQRAHERAMGLYRELERINYQEVPAPLMEFPIEDFIRTYRNVVRLRREWSARTRLYNSLEDAMPIAFNAVNTGQMVNLVEQAQRSEERLTAVRQHALEVQQQQVDDFAQLLSTAQQYGISLGRERQQMMLALQDEVDDFWRARLRQDADFQKQLLQFDQQAAQAEAQIYQQIAQLQDSTNQQTIDAMDKFNKESARQLEDHMNNLARIRRDASDDIEDAVARRDFAAAFRRIRDRDKAIADAEQQYNITQQRRLEDLQDLINNLNKQKQERLADYIQQLADLKKKNLDQRAEMIKEFYERRSLEDEDRRIRLERQRRDQALAQYYRDQDYQRQINDLINNNQTMRQIRQAGFTELETAFMELLNNMVEGVQQSALVMPPSSVIFPSPPPITPGTSLLLGQGLGFNPGSPIGTGLIGPPVYLGSTPGGISGLTTGFSSVMPPQSGGRFAAAGGMTVNLNIPFTISGVVDHDIVDGIIERAESTIVPAIGRAIRSVWND